MCVYCIKTHTLFWINCTLYAERPLVPSIVRHARSTSLQCSLLFFALLKRWRHCQHNESIHDASQCGKKDAIFFVCAFRNAWRRRRMATNAGIETTLFIGWKRICSRAFRKTDIPFGNLHSSSRLPVKLPNPLLPSVLPANARETRIHNMQRTPGTHTNSTIE